MTLEIIAEGLRFPEGPVWMEDGSVIIVEIETGLLSRVQPDGTKHVIAKLGGGPNGAARGPGGRVFVCNNGGFEWTETDGKLFPGHQPHDYSGGRIEVVDPQTGKVERLYDSCDGHGLRGPNDLVFDAYGGFYFTDLGKSREREWDQGGIYYAQADGSAIKPVVYGIAQPNGCALSPDGKTLYAALTYQRVVMAYDLTAPGKVDPSAAHGRPLASFAAGRLIDSMACTADGDICVGALVNDPAIASINPVSGEMRDFACPNDLLPTNICFGGTDMQDAWITLSHSGKLAKVRWDKPGLKLSYY